MQATTLLQGDQLNKQKLQRCRPSQGQTQGQGQGQSQGQQKQGRGQSVTRQTGGVKRQHSEEGDVNQSNSSLLRGFRRIRQHVWRDQFHLPDSKITMYLNFETSANKM